MGLFAHLFPSLASFKYTGHSLLLTLNYLHHGEAPLVFEAHETWGRGFEKLHPRMPEVTLADVDNTNGRPLVVSWELSVLSADVFSCLAVLTGDGK